MDFSAGIEGIRNNHFFPTILRYCGNTRYFQIMKKMRNFSVVALNVAFSVVFDEATDTDSEENAELRPSIREEAS